MISLLILVTENSLKLENAKNLLLNLKSNTSDAENLEVIIKVDNKEQKTSLDNIIKNINPDFRTVVFVQIRSNEVAGIHSNYDNLYLQTSDESKLLILADDKIKVTSEWDKNLHGKYQEAKESLKHDLVLLKQKTNNLTIISTVWADAIGGFGHSPHVFSWMEKINNEIKNYDADWIINLNIDLITNISSPPPVTVDYDSLFVKEIIKYQALSLLLFAYNEKREKLIKKEFRGLSITEACNYINKKYKSFDNYSIPLIRYCHSTTQYIIRCHVIPFIDVITAMVLCKSNQLPYESLPPDWIQHVEKWTLDGQEPTKVAKVNGDIPRKTPKPQNNEEEFIRSSIKKYGSYNTFIFIAKRMVMLPIRKLLKK